MLAVLMSTAAACYTLPAAAAAKRQMLGWQALE